MKLLDSLQFIIFTEVTHVIILRFKLVSLLVLITCISLTVVGITNYRLSRDKLIHQMKEQSITSVSNSAQNLYDFLSIRLAEVELLSRVEL